MTASTSMQDLDRAELALRVTPPWLLGRASRVVERNVLVYRRKPLVFLSALVEPILYLFALGVGVGALVGDVTGPGGQPVSYGAFVAPALLAASAMNGAVYESTFNLYSKLKFEHLYDAMLATPLTSRDIAVGETSWALLRGSLYSVAFLAVAALAGLVSSWWSLLAIPAATLIGFAFAGIAMTATTFMTSWQDFDLVQLVLMPLFLFSATFFPLEVYPGALQVIVVMSPLYHGVELVRGLMLGSVGPGLLVHVAVLAALGAIGVRFAGRRLDTLLVR
jgi:lipooligosaccharide transport system permease protein